MTKKADLTGIKFERLTALSYSHRKVYNGKGLNYWLCQCDCGKICFASIGSLMSGHNKSCGCLNKERLEKGLNRFTHRMTKSKEYRAWVNMRSRCYNPDHRSWPNYGGRGIIVCKRWLSSFISFYNDVGPAPSPRHSIDRKRVNGNYTKSNVRWATREEQANNRRD